MKVLFLLSLLAVGCLEAPPSNISQPDSGTPDMLVEDMSRPDVGVEDMSAPNNLVLDMSAPDAEPDVLVQDMPEDLPEPGPEPFELTLVAPEANSPQTDIPLWVRIDAPELGPYSANRGKIHAGEDVPTELAYLRPTPERIGFWVKWPLLTEVQTMLPVHIEPGQPVADEALWSDFAHVWHMKPTASSIPSSKGEMLLTAEQVAPDANFLGPAFRGYAHAENITVGQEFTIMFWFRYSAPDNIPVRILSLNESPASSEFRLELVGDYLKMFQFGANHSHSTTPLAANQFHHVVLVRTASGVSIRVNGELWGSNGAQENAWQSTFSVKVGQSGKDLAFAELWMAAGQISEERTVLLYRNQSQAVQNSPNSLIVTGIRP